MEEGEEGGLVGGEEVEEVGESGECFKGKYQYQAKRKAILTRMKKKKNTKLTRATNQRSRNRSQKILL